ncbi:MAG: response regulator [Pseudomonadales bacterium]|nr:response regulator [Pseudomonadales bacterium]
MAILIVDDSFLMRSAIKNILSQDTKKFVIEEAEDGLQALDLIRENEYQVILLDIEMPNMDGIEFLKRSKLYSEAAIIIVSSLARMESVQVEKAICFGAFDVVAKPSGVMSACLEAEKKHEILDAVNRSLATV